MTAGVAHHLVSRAVDITQQHFNGNDGEKPAYQLSGWALIAITATFLIYLGMISMVSRPAIPSKANISVRAAGLIPFFHQISYTYGDVVATLTMIETPTATAFKTEYTDEDGTDASLLSQDEKSDKTRLLEPDLFLVKQKPITSKMCTTIRHIRAQAGPLARFRGIHVSIIYHLLHGAIVGFFSSHVVDSQVARPFIAVIASIALCRLQMTWTHIVISKPSSKGWFSRIPSRAAVKNIIVPTAVFAVAEQASIHVPRALYFLCSLAYKEEAGVDVGHAQHIAFLQMIFIGLIGIGIFVLVVIPADVTLKRVQASMLPEEDDSIVPFDRTFNGKVVPQTLGGSGAVSMLEAWKSFDSPARIRLMKLYLKVILVSAFTTLAFTMILIGELRLIMGDGFSGAVEKAHQSLQQVKAGNPMF